MTATYIDFLKSKAIEDVPTGIADGFKLPSKLFDFQNAITAWAIKRGRALIAADCGLGKTPMQLSWAREIHRITGKNILLLAPLAVAQQTVREGKKFGIEVNYCRNEADAKPGLTITNYECLEKHFCASHFGGVVLDESSILKSYNGKFRSYVISAFANIPFKLACTATPAPNDYMELGNHAEFLGVMSRTEMLCTFFYHDSSNTSEWKLKSHAENDFWRWVSSWAMMIRKPSDIGFSDKGFALPPLKIHKHILDDDKPRDGFLFAMPAATLSEQREIKRNTIEERCKFVYKIVKEITIKCTKTNGSQNTKKHGGSKKQQMLHIRHDAKSNGPLQTKRIKDQATAKDTIKRTKINSEHMQSSIVQKGGVGLIPDIILIQHSEKKSRTRSKNTIEDIQKRNLKQELEHMDSIQVITGRCLKSKKENAPFALLASQMAVQKDRKKDSQLTIVTKRKRSGESCAANVTSDLESSKIVQSDCDQQLDTLIERDDSVLIWCELNDEQDQLEKVLKGKCISIRGADSSISKEDGHLEWTSGKKQAFITKSSIFGHGLNWQHCHTMIFVSVSHSYEKFYQAVRRCWRFGQKHPVDVHQILMSSEMLILDNQQRKAEEADAMSVAMVKHMKESMQFNIRGVTRDRMDYKPENKLTLPKWI